MRTLIVGYGQVGRAVGDALGRMQGGPPTVTSGIDWTHALTAGQEVCRQVDTFVSTADPDEELAVCWSAGAAVIGSPSDRMAAERSVLASVLDHLQRRAGGRPALRLVLASSAGGLHASADGTAVDESTPPSIVSEYGRHKLAQEDLVRSWAAATGLPALLARISTVYGPGQDLTKAQGFIAHLCRAMLERRTFTISVPPDTIRDFVHSRDVGSRIAVWMTQDTCSPRAATKLVVSGRSTTLLEAVETVRAVSRIPVRLAISSNAESREQALRMRFETRELLELDRLVPSTGLVEGVSATWRQMLAAHCRSAVSRAGGSPPG